MPEERTAVLIIRAWLEPHPSLPLRASIHWTTDVAGGFRSTLNLMDAEAVSEFVRSWLHEVEVAESTPLV